VGIHFPSIRILLHALALSIAALAGFSSTSLAAVGGYKKSTEGEDVIKNKLYPTVTIISRCKMWPRRLVLAKGLFITIFLTKTN
jgi:hypothetical protein